MIGNQHEEAAKAAVMEFANGGGTGAGSFEVIGYTLSDAGNFDYSNPSVIVGVNGLLFSLTPRYTDVSGAVVACSPAMRTRTGTRAGFHVACGRASDPRAALVNALGRSASLVAEAYESPWVAEYRPSPAPPEWFLPSPDTGVHSSSCVAYPTLEAASLDLFGTAAVPASPDSIELPVGNRPCRRDDALEKEALAHGVVAHGFIAHARPRVDEHELSVLLRPVDADLKFTDPEARSRIDAVSGAVTSNGGTVTKLDYLNERVKFAWHGWDFDVYRHGREGDEYRLSEMSVHGMLRTRALAPTSPGTAAGEAFRDAVEDGVRAALAEVGAWSHAVTFVGENGRRDSRRLVICGEDCPLFEGLSLADMLELPASRWVCVSGYDDRAHVVEVRPEPGDGGVREFSARETLDGGKTYAGAYSIEVIALA